MDGDGRFGITRALISPLFALRLRVAAVVAPPQEMSPAQRRLDVARVLGALDGVVKLGVAQAQLHALSADEERLAARISRVPHTHRDKLLRLRELERRHELEVLWVLGVQAGKDHLGRIDGRLR